MINAFRPVPRFSSMEKVNQIVARRQEAEDRAAYETLQRKVGSDYRANRQEIVDLMTATVYESPFGRLSGLDVLQAVQDTGSISPYSFLKDELPDAGDRITEALGKMEALGLLGAFWANRHVSELGEYILQRVKYNQGF